MLHAAANIASRYRNGQCLTTVLNLTIYVVASASK